MLHNKQFRTFILIAICAVSGGALFANPTATHAEGVSKVQKAPYTQMQVIVATNNARSLSHLNTLTVSKALTRAAQKKADDMVRNKYYSHESPTGVKYIDFIRDEKYSYRNAAENLASRYSSVNALTKAWLNSPTHRANILGSQYTNIGVGIAYGELRGKKGWYVVELLGTRMPAQLLAQI